MEAAGRRELAEAWQAFRSGRRQEALDLLLRHLERPEAKTDPEAAPLWGAAAAFAQALGRDQDAVAWAQRALALDDGEATAHTVLGDAALKDRRLSAAIQHLGRAYDLFPTAYRAARWARALRLGGQVARAWEVARTALARWPEDPSLLTQAAEAAQAAGAMT